MKRLADATGLLLVLSIVGGGCAGEPDSGPAAPVGSGSAALEGQEVDGGAPYDAVVKIRVTGGTSPCTATKIGPRRLLTSAGCAQDGIVAGRTLHITNTDDGIFSEGAVWSVARVLTHPSFENAGDGLFDQSARPSYDLAVIDLASDLPGEWPILPIRVAWLAPGESGSGPYVGYSCTDGKKRENQQWPVDLEDIIVEGGLPGDLAVRVDAYDIASYSQSFDPPATSCPVDRGAPYLVDGEVAGVLDQVGPNEYFYAARTGNAYRWLQLPEKNHIAHGERGTLLNLDSNLCAGVRGQSRDPLAQLAQYDCQTPDQTADHEYWQLISRPGDVYQLKNGRSGLCMVPPNNNENTPVLQGSCAIVASGSAQAWWILPRGNGVIIRNSANGKCLAPLGGSRAPNALLVQTLCNAAAPTPSQIWSFVR